MRIFDSMTAEFAGLMGSTPRCGTHGRTLPYLTSRDETDDSWILDPATTGITLKIDRRLNTRASGCLSTRNLHCGIRSIL